ncbi:ATP-dependent protease La domain-containing protein [Blyttiomyces helicus]|uniref:ATP-dependent protease La domain-containing protein n=1 Tax=Blyttiomyces helicus TaxID=388810 RepID=A0A4P9VY34_9FUNG|nr:ATP-dependent protease La domain-containing protein [Blyttiomyces helicus]|eukprot:RKO83220.1 ATP-dependent protease La domain-containing protein [Blyttiomyces helicus]
MSDTAPPIVFRSLPIITTGRNKVLYPGVVLQLKIKKDDSKELMEQMWDLHLTGKTIIIGCVPLIVGETHSDSHSDETTTKAEAKIIRPIDAEHLFGWGTAARVISFKKNNPYQIKVTKAAYILTLEGVTRFKLEKITKTVPFFEADIGPVPEREINLDDPDMVAIIAAFRTAGNDFANVLSTLQIPQAVLVQLRQKLDSTPIGQLADLFVSVIDLSPEERLQILATVDVKTRIHQALGLLTRQVQVLKISAKLQTNVENNVGSKQRELALRRQVNGWSDQRKFNT